VRFVPYPCCLLPADIVSRRANLARKTNMLLTAGLALLINVVAGAIGVVLGGG